MLVRIGFPTSRRQGCSTLARDGGDGREVKTGERRVIEFFISPFIKYVDESLTLR
jgi:hypothetical protein